MTVWHPRDIFREWLGLTCRGHRSLPQISLTDYLYKKNVIQTKTLFYYNSFFFVVLFCCCVVSSCFFLFCFFLSLPFFKLRCFPNANSQATNPTKPPSKPHCSVKVKKGRGDPTKSASSREQVSSHEKRKKTGCLILGTWRIIPVSK